MTTLDVAPAPPRLSFASRYRSFVARHASLMPTLAAIAILLLISLGAQIYFGNFVTPGNISSLLLDNAYLLILAVGMTFVIITGGIDLSVGSVIAFTGIWWPRCSPVEPRSLVAVLVITMGGSLIGALIGVLVEYFNVRHSSSLSRACFSLGALIRREPLVHPGGDRCRQGLLITRWSLGRRYITPWSARCSGRAIVALVMLSPASAAISTRSVAMSSRHGSWAFTSPARTWRCMRSQAFWRWRVSLTRIRARVIRGTALEWNSMPSRPSSSEAPC